MYRPNSSHRRIAPRRRLRPTKSDRGLRPTGHPVGRLAGIAPQPYYLRYSPFAAEARAKLASKLGGGTAVRGSHMPQTTDATASSSRKRKQFAVVAVLITALLLQGLWAFATEPEPYPAVRLPGFGDAPTADGQFADSGLEIEVRYANGLTLRPTPDILASDIRFSSARPTLDEAFRPGPDGAPNPNSSNERVIAWIKKRASLLTSSPPSEVTFCWRTRVINISDATYTYRGECELTKVRM